MREQALTKLVDSTGPYCGYKSYKSYSFFFKLVAGYSSRCPPHCPLLNPCTNAYFSTMCLLIKSKTTLSIKDDLLK